jgi:hypothetical protein
LARIWRRGNRVKSSGAAILAACVLGGSTPAREPGPRILSAVVESVLGGASPEDETFEFINIRGLALDDEQRLFVADGRTGEVRVFARNGRHLFTLEDSGEKRLAEPCCIGVSPGKQLWIKETKYQKYLVFQLAPRGLKFVRSIGMPGNPTGGLGRLSWDRYGNVVDIATARTPTAGKITTVRWVIGLEGQVVRADTLSEPPPDSVVRVVSIQRNAGVTATTIAEQPFGPSRLHAVGPNGELAEATSSAYAVSWYDLDGNRIALANRVAEGPLLSKNEHLAAERKLFSVMKTLRIEAPPFGVPEHKPPLEKIGFDLEGRLWVKLSSLEGRPNEADVYDRRGAHVARVKWPADIRLDGFAVRGWLGFGWKTDANGVQRVVSLRFR